MLQKWYWDGTWSNQEHLSFCVISTASYLEPLSIWLFTFSDAIYVIDQCAQVASVWFMYYSVFIHVFLQF